MNPYARANPTCLRPDFHCNRQAFLDALAAFVEPVPIHFLWRPQLHDPADELVLEAAVNAAADALLSFNLRHFRPAAERFGLLVAPPGPFLHEFLRGTLS